MRATRAYITSLGTTGMLIASALLSLSVMSAFVAFNGFPGQSVQAPIGSLLVGEQHPPTVTVPTRPLPSHAVGASHAGARAGAQRASGHSRTVKSPVAHANPVNSAPSGQAPAQAPSSSAPTPQPSTTQVTPGTVSDPLPTTTTTPSLPTTDVPLPQISLPPPPQTSQLPVDTSGVTGILGQ